MADPSDLAGESDAASDLRVTELTELDQLERAALLLAEVWGVPPSSVPVPADVMRALQLSGNYVTGAFDSSGALCGASVAWATPEQGRLHSHITGVPSRLHRRGIGLALKLHQRAWALERGFTVITWTFDPLVGRNAGFNLGRLGAVVDSYVENVYGPLADEINEGDESDRLLVAWQIGAGDLAPRESRPARPRQDGSPAAVGRGEDGGPVVHEEALSSKRYRVAIPGDVEALRSAQPEAARRWRLALRRALGEQMAKGARVVGLDEDGSYVVEQSPL